MVSHKDTDLVQMLDAVTAGATAINELSITGVVKTDACAAALERLAAKAKPGLKIDIRGGM